MFLRMKVSDMEAVFLTPVVDSAIKALVAACQEEIKLIWGVDEELDSLLNTLSAIRSVLADAEEKQITSNLVKDWLRKLKNATYDVEDIVDEFIIEASRGKMEEGADSSKIKQVNNFNLCSCWKKVAFRHEIAYRMRDIREKLDKIARDRHDFDLVVRDVGRPIPRKERANSTSLVDESGVLGRQNDKENLIKLLVSDEASGEHPLVLPIVAMGGLGKTTLAQFVYNSKEVQKNFPLRAWICVTEDFDLARITRGIVESLTGNGCDLIEIEPLQLRLKNFLMGDASSQSEQKRFLIVLDDMWSEDPSDWENLRLPFIYGASGSRIIVTTRSRKVASIMGTVPAYNLKGLPLVDCWKLFVKKAFAGESLESYPNLVTIGKNIVEKCGGVPLAVKSLGGLLSTRRSEKEWRHVYESPIWNLPQKDNDILPALRLSYSHLPAHLKSCFAYCALFPKDYMFKKDELTEIWIAEGYIHADGYKEEEELANEYFDDLLLRSFFIHDSNWKWETKYKMHDLIHDLAESVSKEECVRMGEGRSFMVPQRARLSSFVSQDFLTTAKLDGLFSHKSLRTFLFLGLFPYRVHMQVFSNENLQLVLYLKCLRVLRLESTGIEELPSAVGDLKLLKFIDLSHTRIRSLPISICKLYNLQSLKLKQCKKLLELPKDMKNLVNLLYLDTEGCDGLLYMPLEIGKLKKLRTLSRFAVGKQAEMRFGELKDMVDLRYLGISRLENVANANAPMEANLINKGHLDSLTLEWTWLKGTREKNMDKEVLTSFQPPVNLRSLRIYGYAGDSLPNWLKGLTSLQNLTLYHCRQAASMTELPASLQNLTITLSPSLRKRCKLSGRDWLKVAHIPKVCIDGEYITASTS